MINKKGFEFSFGWIFAFIAGAMIIFLGIYAATRFGEQEGVFTESKTAKEIGILASSFETSLEEDKPDSISFQIKTTIYNGCDEKGIFGKQKISTKSSSKIGNNAGLNISLSNRYFFSEREVEGKKILIWSKPFKMPFKVANLLYVIGEDKKYCFIDAPRNVEDTLGSLIENNELINRTIVLSSFEDKNIKCENRIEVCFNRNCEISVLENEVRKEGKKVYYSISDEDESLLYAAIFSEPEIYECQLKRLMKRATQLALLYSDKSVMLGVQGCGAGLDDSLQRYAQLSAGFKKSEDILMIADETEKLRRENEALACQLF